MYICYGISNGPQNPWPFSGWENDDRYLWSAGPNCGIGVQSKDDLVLTVDEFDPKVWSIVKIVLKRKGSETPLVELMQNSHSLGKPELVWGEYRE